MLVIKPVDSLVHVLRESFASIGLERVSTRLGIALLVVSSLFFAANFADKAWVSYQVAQQKAQLITEIRQAKQQIGQFSTDLKYMQTRAYYVEAARNFGFVQPGDLPLSISTTAASPQATTTADSAPPPLAKKHSESFFTRVMQAIVPGF